MLLVLALLIGLVAGLRALTAPAIVSFAARFGDLDLSATPLAFLGYTATPWILGALALAELITEQLPATPSRKVAVQFGTRLLTGGLSGAAIGAHGGMLVPGLVAGVVGAVIGLYAGAAGRDALAKAFRNDHPAGLIEDAVAVGGAILIVSFAA
jgi:uncharacterized membrane protein